MTYPCSECFVPVRPGVEFAGLTRGNCIIVISPHPDDDVIGMGGTMALTAPHTAVYSVYMTNGAGSLRKDSKVDVAQARRQEALAALACVGAHGAFFLRGESTWCRDYENAPAQFYERLQSIFTYLHPQAVYVTGPFEKHITHLGSTSLVVKVLRQVMGQLAGPCKLYGYPVWAPFFGNSQDVTVVDITAVIPDKRKAILAHEGEVGYKPYDEGVLGSNRYNAVFFDAHSLASAAYIELFLSMDKLLTTPGLTLGDFAKEQADRFVREIFSQR